MPVVEIKGAARRNVCNGRKISVPGVSGSFRVEDDGELLAIYNGDGESGRAEVVLCAGS